MAIMITHRILTVEDNGLYWVVLVNFIFFLRERHTYSYQIEDSLAFCSIIHNGTIWYLFFLAKNIE